MCVAFFLFWHQASAQPHYQVTYHVSSGCSISGLTQICTSYSYTFSPLGRPLSVTITTTSSDFDDCCSFDPITGDCSIGYCVNPTTDIVSESFPDVDCYVGSVVSWRPANLTFVAPPSGDFCESNNINVTARAGYGSYSWYYATSSTGTFSFIRNTTSNTTSISKSDIPGIAFGQNFFVRYGIGTCSLSDISIQISPAYRFNPVAPVVDTYTAEAPECQNGTDGSINVTLNRSLQPGETLLAIDLYDTPSISASPITNSTTTTISGLASGTYHALVRTTLSCGDPVFKQVVVPSGPRIPLTGSLLITSNYNGSQVSCQGSTDGQVTVSGVSGGRSPYQYSLNGGPFQGTPTFNVGAGSYHVTIRDDCTTPATYTMLTTNSVSVSEPSQVLATGVPSLCNTLNNGQIIVTSSGGTGAKQYRIDGGAYQTSNVFTGLTAGIDHVIQVRDANLCESSLVSVSVPAPLIVGTVEVTQPTCFGQTGKITVTGSGGGTGPYRYSLNGSAYQVSNEFLGLGAGSYVVRVQDATLVCETSASSVTVTVPPAVSVTRALVEPSCFGLANGSITITASDGVAPFEYSINNGTNYFTTNVFTGLSSGIYTLRARGANGCESAAQVINLTQPSPVGGTIATLPTFSCFSPGNGGTINLTPSGGTPPFSYSWRDNTTNTVISTAEDAPFALGSLLSNTYTVTITDSRGCVGTRTTPTITQPAQLISSAVKTDITCFGASNGSVNLTVTGGTSPYLYAWNNGATTEDLINRPPGLYSVTVTDANGCTTNTSATIIQPAQLTLSQGTTSHVLCNGQANGSVTLNAIGGTGAYEYSRDGITWQPSSTISGLNATSHTLRVRDQNLCINQIIVMITQPPVLTASVGSIQGATCGQSNGSASSSASGGTGTYSFVWRNGLNQVVSSAPTLINVPGGTYRVTVTDQNGCTDFEDAAIPSPDGPQATINSTTPTRCSDSNDGRATITVSQGQAPYTIVWNNGETGLNPVALLPGTGINIVTITDATGCITSQVVDVPSPPTLAATPPVIQQATCPAGTNGSIQTLGAGGTAPYTYAWNTGATTSLLNNIGAGTYSLTIRDANNCTITESITLSDKPAITVQTVSEVAPTCAGRSDGSISVNAIGGNGTFSYAWNTGSTGSTLASIGAGTYTVTATDVLGCTSQRTFVFADPPPLSLDLGPDRKICVGGILTIASPENAASYVWSSSNGFSSTLKQVTLTQAGEYTLRIINANGCVAEDTFTLTTATDLLSADFLMIPQAEAGDTIIVIDISWPVPEGIVWTLPSEATVLERTPDYATMVFDNPGRYEVILTASLAQCQDEYRGTIDIQKRTKNSGGRLSTQSEPLIRSVTAFPVPTKDRISGMIELSQESAVTIRLVSPERNLAIRTIEGFGRSVYEFDFEVSSLPRGVYFLIFESGREAKVIRVAVI